MRGDRQHVFEVHAIDSSLQANQIRIASLINFLIDCPCSGCRYSRLVESRGASTATFKLVRACLSRCNRLLTQDRLEIFWNL